MLPYKSKQPLPFTITKIFPDNYTMIKYLIILCYKDYYYLFDNVSIKYPNIDIRIKEKLTSFIIKCSCNITVEFLDDIFKLILNVNKNFSFKERKFFIYYINYTEPKKL